MEPLVEALKLAFEGMLILMLLYLIPLERSSASALKRASRCQVWPQASETPPTASSVLQKRGFGSFHWSRQSEVDRRECRLERLGSGEARRLSVEMADGGRRFQQRLDSDGDRSMLQSAGASSGKVRTHRSLGSTPTTPAV